MSSETPSTYVKICGMRSEADCTAAQEAGAHLLGFNFWPKSVRFVSPETAAGFCNGTGAGLSKVGLFVDASEESIRDVLSVCSLDYLQFHGSESPAFCRRFGVPFIKAFRLQSEASITAIGDYVDSDDQLFLVDAHVAGRPGGTGRQIDTKLALRARDERGRMMLAGGLTPSNVGPLVQLIQPWGVDVASGVESAPGKKDRDLIHSFVDAVEDASP